MSNLQEVLQWAQGRRAEAEEVERSAYADFQRAAEGGDCLETYGAWGIYRDALAARDNLRRFCRDLEGLNQQKGGGE